MNLRELLDDSLCFAGMEARDWEDALRQLSRVLYKKSIVNKEFEENVIKREKEFPTGLPMDAHKAAIPHTYPEYVNNSAICIATLKDPVEFYVMGSPEEKVSVDVVIMLAIKDGSQQVEVLKQLINGIIKDSKLICDIVNSPSGQEIYNSIIKKLDDN